MNCGGSNVSFCLCSSVYALVFVVVCLRGTWVHHNGTVCFRRCIFHYCFILIIAKTLNFILLSKDELKKQCHTPASRKIFLGICSYQKIHFISFCVCVCVSMTKSACVCMDQKVWQFSYLI